MLDNLRYRIARWLLKSDEIKGIQMELVNEFSRSKGISVQVSATDDEMQRLFDRIHRVWTEYGESEPHFSVLTHEKFKSNNINNNLDEFYESGNSTAALINEYFARAGLKPIRGTCLEFGCGVGRATKALAKQFDKVMGVDISAGNLRHAQDYLNQNEIQNVELLHHRSVQDVAELPPFDFLFSTIVFQHNPPPVQFYLLDKLLGKIVDGGGCLFQLATEMPDSNFDLKSYLQTESDGMEMHSLPMHAVLSLLRKHRLEVVEVRPDGWTGEMGSFTFFAYPKHAAL